MSRRIFNARALRQTSGMAERVCWSRLRGGRIDGHKFRRQHPIGRFIVDFACDRLRLVIELDGGVHDREDVALSDLHRQREIESLGWTVLRFGNEEALAHPERLTAAIRLHAGSI